MEGTLQKTKRRRSDERVLRDNLRPGTLNSTRTDVSPWHENRCVPVADVSPWHVVRRTWLLRTRESCVPAVCLCPRRAVSPPCAPQNLCVPVPRVPPPPSVPPMKWYTPRYQTGVSPRVVPELEMRCVPPVRWRCGVSPRCQISHQFTDQQQHGLNAQSSPVASNRYRGQSCAHAAVAGDSDAWSVPRTDD
jgi:hypothetical protein